MSTEDINKEDLEMEQKAVEETVDATKPLEEEGCEDLFDDDLPFEIEAEELGQEEEEPLEEEEEPLAESEEVPATEDEEETPEIEVEAPLEEVEEQPEEVAKDSEEEEVLAPEEEEEEEVVIPEAKEEDQFMYKDPNEPEKTDEYFNTERDRYLRLFAEFENYRRRTIKEREELMVTAGKDILSAMLPIVDDFDRALVEISKTADANTLQGVQLIYNKLLSTLKSKGLERIQVAPNDVFDSECHDAITQIPAPSPEYRGRIVDVIQAGYKLGDKVIRFPKVVVAQ